MQKLRQENKELKDQLTKVQGEMELLKNNLTSSFSDFAPNETGSQTIEFLSAKYDDLDAFKNKATKEIKDLSKKIDLIAENVNRLEKCIEDMEAYSYKFNLKIVGVPNTSGEKETAMDTASLCLNLFHALGAKEVKITDIDTAHRVPSRTKRMEKPDPIICKFIRRLPKDEVMANRNNRQALSSEDLGLESHADLSRVRIFDHLTPKLQKLFYEAKKYKTSQDYDYCWVKNGVVNLRESSSSPIIKLRSMDDLALLSTSS
mgnify:CR=1 FL=1